MPATLKKGRILYKNNSGTYTGLDVITDKTTDQQIKLIQNAKGYIFTQANQFVEDLKSSLPENFQTILENFSSTYIPENHQYAVGDYCTHEGIMYRCIAATSGDFASACWENVDMGGEFKNTVAEINDLKNAVNDSFYTLIGRYNLVNGWIDGKTLDTSGAIVNDSTCMVSEPIAVHAGTYEIFFTIATAYTRVCGYDSNNDPVTPLFLNAGVARNEFRYPIAIPEGVVTVRISTKKSGKVYGFIEETYIDTQLENMSQAVDDLKVITKNGFFQLMAEDFEKSEWSSTGTKSSAGRTICYKEKIPVKAGDKLITKASALYIGWYLVADGTAVEKYYTSSGNRILMSDTEFVFRHDGDLLINIATGDKYATSASISSSDMTATLYVQTSLAGRLTAPINNLLTSVENNELNYVNLVGMEANILYPVNIPANTKITMSTADGTAYGSSSLNLHLYDESKNYITNYNFTQSAASRTISYDANVKYLSWGIVPAKLVQVEIGDRPSTYNPYHYPVGKRLAEIESDVGAIQAMIGDLQDAIEDAQEQVASNVQFTAQSLTDAQKVQARMNIGAGSEADVSDLKSALTFQTSSKIDVQQGYYSATNGETGESNTWCRTDFIDRDTILKSTAVKMYLLAYNLDDSYVGIWNGSVFSTTYTSSAYFREIVAHNWMELYPNYKFRVTYTASGTLTPAAVLSDITVEHLTDNEIDHAKNVINMADKTLSTDAVGTGYGINAGNGNTTENSILSYTAYIDVSKYAYIKYKRILSTAESPIDGIAFYNASKSNVSGSGVTSKSNQESAGYDSGLFEVKVPDNAKYVRFSMLSDTETYGVFEAYGIYPICDAIRATDECVAEIIESNELNYKNLAGMEANVYYPVNIPAGTYVVMSTADGQALGQSGLSLYFYDENQTYIEYWNFTQNKSFRTVTAPGSVPTRYLRWNKTPAKDVQVEVGFKKTDYVPYHYPVGKRLAEIESNVDAFVARGIFNGEPYEGTYDWQTPVVEYGALFNGVSNVETFGFFTDPHVMGFTGRNEPNMQEYIKKVSRVFRSAPCRNFVCGGDWLNNDTVANEACYRLGYIKALAKNMLCDCKLVLGNHDTNYQGKATEESERGTGTLTNDTIHALMFNDTETRKAYYSFDGTWSKCYVLDTGIEHNTMNAYDWEQVAWLGGKLIEDDADHSIIFLHIITNNGNVQTNTSNFASLVQAYNAHTTITLNGTQYDFRNYEGHKCTGKVELWVGGHTHSDSSGTLGGIPYIITGSLSYNSNIPLIDLMLVDYDNHVLKTIRVGTGENRTIALST